MNQKIKLLLFFICIVFTNPFFAQLDKSNSKKEKGKIKAVVKKNSKEVKKPKSIGLNGNEGFKKAYDKEKEKLQKKQKEETLKNKGILTKELARKIKFQKFVEKNTLQIPMIDIDIGVFRTKSKNINLICFDFGRIDGDVITILKNGVAFKENINLRSSNNAKTIVIPLDKGFNKIEILAVNEGYLRPNTGAFTLFDDFNKQVFSDLWTLAKGAKVIAHIIRE